MRGCCRMNDFRRIWQGVWNVAAMDCWKAGFCGSPSLGFGDLMILVLNSFDFLLFKDLMLCQLGWLVR